MRIGWDLDGVEYHFYRCVVNTIKHFGLDNKYKINSDEATTWHFYRDWGMTDKEFVSLCHDGADAGIIFAGEAREGPEAMNLVKSKGHSVHIITDRSFGKSPQVSQDITARWLKEHGFRYDTLTFSSDKTVIETDRFIEDKVENYDALDKKGVEVYLINRPWNLQDDSRRRVNSTMEFAELL